NSGVIVLLSLMALLSPIDVDGSTGDVAGFFADQPRHRGRHFLGPPETTHDQLARFLFDPFGSACTAVSGVSIGPGATQFTRTSGPSARVSPATPAFDAV